MTQLKDMILQLFFALAPFVIFNIVYRDKMKNFSRSFILLTSSVCLLLSMSFAASVVDGLLFDMRYVIMFFGLVFGGVQTGLILLVEFALYRLYLGGEGTLAGIMIIAVTFAVSLLFSRLYKTAHRKSLVTFAAGIVYSVFPLALTYAFFPDYVVLHLAFHIVAIPVQNSIGIWLLMSLFSKSVADKNIFIKHAQNEKREAMSHVAASLAHEVRNPLTAVKGFLKLIREKPYDLPKLEQYIAISMDEIQRTESIISEYLSISKPPSERREIINFSDQLQIVADVMTPYANMYNVELEVHKPDSAVLLLANPDEIKQVLVNFIKNAVEACTEAAAGKIALTLITEKRLAKLSIKDNGSGMTPQQINRLGSIYFSTKSNGTGLGLTYSYQVIQSLGGSVSVSSNPREGTTFTVAIPLRQNL